MTTSPGPPGPSPGPGPSRTTGTVVEVLTRDKEEDEEGEEEDEEEDEEGGAILKIPFRFFSALVIPCAEVPLRRAPRMAMHAAATCCRPWPIPLRWPAAGGQPPGAES
jgi:hypothetical protein